MPPGRKLRVATATLPPKGYYVSHLAPLAAVRDGGVSPAAAHLWTIIRAHAWQDGRCDLTDRELGAWMGGLSERQISNLRMMLVEAGLLTILKGAPGRNERWLLPQPAQAAKSISGESAFTGTARQQQEEVNADKYNPPPAPETYGVPRSDITQSASANEQRDGGGMAAPVISPAAGFTAKRRQVASAATGGSVVASAGAAPAAGSAPTALSAFLVERGAFPPVAASLAEGLLARMALTEAQVYALAHLTAIEASADVLSRRIYGERIVGRWVARLRDGSAPPRWAVHEAEVALAAGQRASEGDLAAAEHEEPSADDNGSEAGETAEPSASAPEERPWIVGDGRACSNRELWSVALSQLRLQLPRSTFETWLAASRCAGLNGTGCTLVIQVSSGHAVEWLTLRLKPLILRTLNGITGQNDLDVRFEVAQ